MTYQQCYTTVMLNQDKCYVAGEEENGRVSEDQNMNSEDQNSEDKKMAYLQRASHDTYALKRIQKSHCK